MECCNKNYKGKHISNAIESEGKASLGKKYFFKELILFYLLTEDILFKINVRRLSIYHSYFEQEHL